MRETYHCTFMGRTYEHPRGDRETIVELWRPGMGYCGCVYAEFTDDPELEQSLRGMDVDVTLTIRERPHGPERRR